ncbi:MAG: hypothetical protein EHM49_00175 [Deltaproteobacteria bacterium]|nr:MAG: hypothetical protein EHM49_00175 [Deltaproteobacteria bacterium]
MKKCSIVGCDQKHYAKGYCSYHYERFRKYGDPEIVFPGPRIGCLVEGCDGKHFGKGYCRKHYERFKKYGDPLKINYGGISRKENPICSIEGCENPVQARGLCSKHYKRWELYGDPLANFSRVRGECSVKGCSEPAHAHGYCNVHYDRWRRSGDPEGLVDMPKGAIEGTRYKAISVKRKTDLAQILLSRVQIDPESHCWLWEGKSLELGIGQKRFSVTRLSYATFVGDVPKGKLVCHVCDRRNCISPTHMYLGSYKSNRDDAEVSEHLQKEGGLSENKVRLVKLSFLKGKLTKEISKEFGVPEGLLEWARRKVCWGYPGKVKERPDRPVIKLARQNVLKIKALLNDGLSGSEIARQFGVSREMISRIKLGISWKHI